MTSKKQAIRATIARVSDANTTEAINNAIAPSYKWQELTERRLTIIGIQERPSRYPDKICVVVGFQSEGIDGGVFIVGGKPGRYFMSIEQDKLPVQVILHVAGVNKHGDKYPRVERL